MHHTSCIVPVPPDVMKRASSEALFYSDSLCASSLRGGCRNEIRAAAVAWQGAQGGGCARLRLSAHLRIQIVRRRGSRRWRGLQSECYGNVVALAAQALASPGQHGVDERRIEPTLHSPLRH